MRASVLMPAVYNHHYTHTAHRTGGRIKREMRRRAGFREMAGNRLSLHARLHDAALVLITYCGAGKINDFFACQQNLLNTFEYIVIARGAYKRDFSLLLFITTGAINKNKNSEAPVSFTAAHTKSDDCC